MINRLLNNTGNLRTYVSWKMDMNRIFYPSRGAQGVIRFGILSDLDINLLRARGYSEAAIANLKWKIGHPVVEVPVQNDFTGQEGNAVHSFTTRKRVPEMHEFEHRFDKKETGQYLHNQGDVEINNDLEAFKIDPCFSKSVSNDIENELLSQMKESAINNLNISEKFFGSSDFIFSKNELLLDRVNEHFIDCYYNFNEGDLPNIFKD